MKWISLFAVSAAAACILSACDAPAAVSGSASGVGSALSDTEASVPQAAPEASVALSETASSEAPEPAPAVVRASLLGEDEAAPEGCGEFLDYDSAYRVRILFTTDAAVREFSFLSLTFTEEADGALRFETEELYTADAFTPEHPVVIGMTFVGALPDRGICYTDADGTERYFSLDLSGKDGSLLLTEFEPS